MIEVFKITHDIYDSAVSLKFPYHHGSITRGNKYKVINHRYHYDLRKHYFSARIVNRLYGIAYPIMSLMLLLLTCSKHV